ncbi:hypothetical protein EUTSA_v10022189mg [Eutrema salsugineum]|uniref:F-box domain-containing protein n=1 Tax=Eutrema salsugineum TaxID=72664 RepID=V4M5H2_EUTSA|nr:hypothetical protein EUTSA_v10022189mg [Eutrema salsugineum]
MEKIDLPWDLMEEILSRVPAKSLGRLRSTSKRWNALYNSEGFSRKHSANAPKEESLSIMLIDSRVCLVRINLEGIHNNVASSVKVAAQFYLKDPLLSSSHEVEIRNVFHCEGLLLCTTRDYRLVVWNPCSGETKWIKPRVSYEESDFYALGYDNKCSCKQYKILRVGNTYWIAQGGPDKFLLSFDFTTEKFQSLPIPHRFAALSLIREEQLCLLVGGNSSGLHVWVATSMGPVSSWIKLLTVEDRSISFSIGLSFLVDEQNNAVIFCNGLWAPSCKILHISLGNKHIRHEVLRGGDYRESYCQFLLNYVPSFAQIQQGTLLKD